MSLKVERDTVERVTETVRGRGGAAGAGAAAAAAAAAGAPRDGPLPGTSGKHPIAEAIGTAITGGKKNAGTKGYLMVSNTTLSRAHARPTL
jgi:hypothetical protein